MNSAVVSTPAGRHRPARRCHEPQSRVTPYAPLRDALEAALERRARRALSAVVVGAAAFDLVAHLIAACRAPERLGHEIAPPQLDAPHQQWRARARGAAWRSRATRGRAAGVPDRRGPGARRPGDARVVAALLLRTSGRAALALVHRLPPRRHRPRPSRHGILRAAARPPGPTWTLTRAGPVAHEMLAVLADDELAGSGQRSASSPP